MFIHSLEVFSSHSTVTFSLCTGEKPYGCKYCEKRFTQKTGLNQHERIHTGEIPYVCKYCSKRFRNKSSVTFHERKYHTGEKPYECKTCNMSFIQSDRLKNHLKQHDLKLKN